MRRKFEQPEWYEASCYICGERRTDVVKIPANGCGCEAELVACYPCLTDAATQAYAVGALPKEVKHD